MRITVKGMLILLKLNKIALIMRANSNTSCYKQEERNIKLE